MEDKELNLLDHLDELRRRAIYCLITFVVFFIIGFVYVEDIYKFFTASVNGKLLALGPGEIIWIYFSLAGVAGIAASIPMIAYQIWKFVAPALKEREKKATIKYIPLFFILFLIGLAFGYYILFPMILMFVIDLGSEMIETAFTAQKYFSFLLSTLLPIGILFELPLVISFLTNLGLLTPTFLKVNRKYAYFFLYLAAMMITPPDIITAVLVSIPLFGLYEISIFVSQVIYKRKLARDKEWEEAQEFNLDEQ